MNATQLKTDEMITISKKEYEYLKDQSRWLSYLYSAGIDNSEAYDYACQLAREDGFFTEDD